MGFLYLPSSTLYSLQYDGGDVVKPGYVYYDFNCIKISLEFFFFWRVKRTIIRGGGNLQQTLGWITTLSLC